MFDMELRDYTNWDVQSVFKRSDRNKYRSNSGGAA